MRLDDCYRLLDLDPRASDVEVKRAHRDLTKVWHPDRFGNDAALRQKAEQKLKAINEAYESIRESRERGWWAPPPPAPPPAPQVNRRAWAFASALIAVLILLRRPTPAGLVIALILFGVAFMFIARMRRR